MPAPAVEKDAGVEALFWTVHVQDELFGQDLRRVLYHYVRLKVFDEKGKEKAATIDIEFEPKTAIMAVAARTIKADGSILGRRLGAIAVRQAEISGRIGEGRMQLSLDFAADHYSQTMQRLMIVKPGALALGADYVFAPGRGISCWNRRRSKQIVDIEGSALSSCIAFMPLS